MPDVITIDQVNYYRILSTQITEIRDRWNDVLSWYPKQQQEQYGHLGKIYKESLAQYGETEFKKYAQLRRLRSVHTAAIDKPKLEAVQKVSCYPMDYMACMKTSVTTNGAYGLIPPAHHYICMKGNFMKVTHCEKFR